MSYDVVATKRFEKEIKRLTKKFPSLKEEFRRLIDKLSEKPEQGVAIGNNCYKIRLAIESKGKGKTGGARVINYIYEMNKTVYLLSIYDKSEKSDLKPNELKEIIGTIDL